MSVGGRGGRGGGGPCGGGFFQGYMRFSPYDKTNLRSAGHLPLFTFLQAPRALGEHYDLDRQIFVLHRGTGVRNHFPAGPDDPQHCKLSNDALSSSE